MPADAPRRVMVTGIGTVNPLGNSAPAFAAALRAGACAIGPLTLFDPTGFRTGIAAQVSDVERVALPMNLAAALRRRLSRADVFALGAATEALEDSGLDPTPARAGVALGGTTGGMLGAEDSIRKRAGNGRRYRANPLVGAPVSTSADVLAQTLDLRGPRLTVSTACSSSAMAIGIAVDWIRLGQCDVVVAGGCESLCATVFAGFNALHALSPEPCRPFDRHRNGLTLGEGAAILVLEDAGHARARGARIHAELVDYGASADAHHLTAPHPDARGAVLAIRRALAHASLVPSDIGYVNAHGTGTPLNDASEAAALHEVFDEASTKPAVSSTKSAVGHTLGAAGAIEALATVLAVRDAFMPATVTLEEPEDQTLDFVPRTGRAAAVRYALSNSYGFGGNNTSLVIGRAAAPGD